VTLFGSVRAFVENCRIGAKLVDHLATRATRGARDTMVIRYRNRPNFHLRSKFRHCGEDRRPLGAIGHSVRSILHIAAREDLSAVGQNRRSDPEIGVRRMCVLHRLARRAQQSLTRIGRDGIRAHSGIMFLGIETSRNCKREPMQSRIFLGRRMRLDDLLKNSIYDCVLKGRDF